MQLCFDKLIQGERGQKGVYTKGDSKSQMFSTVPLHVEATALADDSIKIYTGADIRNKQNDSCTVSK